jgi:hypothetical protein
MTQVKVIVLSFLISFTLLSSRCRKHCDPENPQTLYFPGELKTYLDFGNGSYWIYKDSASGNIDSLVLAKRTWGWDEAFGTNECKQKVAYKKIESLSMSYLLYRDGSFLYNYTEQTNNSSKLQTSLYDAFTILINDYNNMVVMHFPFSDTSYTGGGYRVTEEFLDSITINGTLYSHVLKINKNLIEYPMNSHLEIYYKDNIGCILSKSRDDLHPNLNFKKQIIYYKIYN